MKASLALGIAALLSVESAAAVDVSSCGQTLGRGAHGVLVADLACGDTALVMENGAQLDMAGRSITVSGSGPGAAIRCIHARCRVYSSSVAPGTLAGPDTFAGISIEGTPIAKLRLSNLQLAGFYHGVQGPTARVFASDVVVNGAAQVGMLAARLYLEQVAASGNGSGLYASTSLKFTDIAANDNAGYGLASTGKIRGTGLTASGNNLGVAGGHIRLLGATVTGNDTDIVSTDRLPRLRASHCDTSSDTWTPGGAPWGVCALDP
jgi:hypothetical protein